MATSSVFYKFINEKDRKIVHFQGTGITVFELKAAIMRESGLGDGTDLDLFIYPEDDYPSNEYDDDTTIIPRTSTVIAKRRPVGDRRGKAARYVSGRAPVRALNKKSAAAAPANPAGQPLTENDAEAAFFQESAQKWDEQKDAMSHAKPVHFRKKPANVPAHEPPPGYVCYRCNQKGHWIQACPTNDDPDFKPTSRPKRTTGIPRSFLQTLDKAPEDLEGQRNVFMDADGKYVKVMQDEKTWNKFSEKAAAQKNQAEATNKEIQDRGLACSYGSGPHIFVDPVKTPCCSKTYCSACAEDALAENDLICPNCEEDCLIDDLVPDEDMRAKVRTYKAEKAEKVAEVPEVKKEEEKVAEVPEVKQEEKPQADQEPSATSHTPVQDTTTDTDPESSSKKRKAADDFQPPSAPKAMRLQEERGPNAPKGNGANPMASFLQDMEALKQISSAATPALTMPTMPAMPAMPSMPSMPMNGWQGQQQWGGQQWGQQGWQQNGYGYGQGGYGAQNWPQAGYQNQWNQQQAYGAYNNQGWGQQFGGYQGNMGFQGNAGNMNGGNMNTNNNSQDAYERLPLNPHRAQNRQRRARPMDYHQVG